MAGSLEEGLEIKAMVQHLETKEGYSLLSESKARAELIWDDLFDMMSRKDVVEVQIKKVTNKGYTVSLMKCLTFYIKKRAMNLKKKMWLNNYYSGG